LEKWLGRWRSPAVPIRFKSKVIAPTEQQKLTREMGSLAKEGRKEWSKNGCLEEKSVENLVPIFAG
jgi:hypothetical protein